MRKPVFWVLCQDIDRPPILFCMLKAINVSSTKTLRYMEPHAERKGSDQNVQISVQLTRACYKMFFFVFVMQLIRDILSPIRKGIYSKRERIVPQEHIFFLWSPIDRQVNFFYQVSSLACISIQTCSVDDTV